MVCNWGVSEGALPWGDGARFCLPARDLVALMEMKHIGRLNGWVGAVVLVVVIAVARKVVGSPTDSYFEWHYSVGSTVSTSGCRSIVRIQSFVSPSDWTVG